MRTACRPTCSPLVQLLAVNWLVTMASCSDLLAGGPAPLQDDHQGDRPVDRHVFSSLSRDRLGFLAHCTCRASVAHENLHYHDCIVLVR
ncbi:hypothetical protein F5Y18DRAFT_376272 [Xylariaceae sp. FL1019]|nr:hypothetical protein F5Y18DRAFT_376272 [Xylariaceae sp. FL1019]